jgi:hypothetical protein
MRPFIAAATAAICLSLLSCRAPEADSVSPRSPAMPQAAPIELLAPVNETVISTPLTARLQWQAPDGGRFRVVLAADRSLRNRVASAAVEGGEWRVALCPETEYWWQVEAEASPGAAAARGGPWSFRTPSPVIRDGAAAAEKYGAARPKHHFAVPYPPYVTAALPEDAAIPLSPWFSRKKYDLPPLPKFAAIKDKLPAPVLDGESNRPLIEAYWYAWQVAFEFYLFEPREKDQAVAYMNACPFWAGWGSMQYFDTSFILQYARYAHGAFDYAAVLDNVYCRQHENGFIIKETDNNNYEVWSSDPTLPPLFAWAEWECYLVSGDKQRLAEVLLPLVKCYEWLQRYQRHSSGLYYTDLIGHGDWGVFMNSSLAQMAASIAHIAGEVGRKDLAKYFRQEARETTALIERNLWDEKHGVYSSLRSGRFTAEPEPGKLHRPMFSTGPLTAGIAPPDHAEKVIRQILDPACFMGKYGVRNLSADSSLYLPDANADFAAAPATPQYPLLAHENVWPPMVLLAVKALENYGRRDEADDLAERYARALGAIFLKCGDITEHSWTDRLEPGGNPKFVGWSGYGPIACLIENVLGFRCDAPHRTLHWRIRRLERHGIERLRVGDVTISLICEARASAADPCRLTVESSGDLDLALDWGKGKKTVHVKAGRTSLTP